ncbi:DMT family transporter [Alphaproteobacteria bacterium]|nr:DMT family transporter [Alphaproteobacteria bacterium]
MPLVFVTLWSSAFITSKIIIDNASPFISLSLRFGVVGLILFIYFLCFSKNKKVSIKAFCNASISGLLFHGFYLGGVFYALSKGISASLIALIVSLQPILTSILARIYLNEKLTRIQWLGVLLGFCGAFIIILSNLKEDLTLLALIAGLVGLISSSLGIIWQKRIIDELPLSANNFIQAFSAFIFYIIITFCFENYYINFTDSFFISMSWQIFAVSLGAFLILMWLLERNKANQTSTLFFLITPISALMAYFILDEQFSYLDFFGLFVSSIGVYIVAKYQSKI